VHDQPNAAKFKFMKGPVQAACCWLSIILPCWRDEARVTTWIDAFPHLRGVEWIVPYAEASEAFITQLDLRHVTHMEVTPPSRGAQMKAGGVQACGDMVLFHHADSLLTQAHLDALHNLHADPTWEWGAFYRKFDERHPRMKCFESIERWHNRTFGAVCGDQSLFMRRDAYTRLGGFAPIPLMEDVELSLRLRKSSPPRMIDPPMASSPRKHLTRGPWKTTCGNLLLLWAFRLGVSPARLHHWYYK
jgi:hypothetical protein